MAERCVDLKLNRDLVDAHFDGYKLALDPLPVYKVKLESDVDVATLTDAQYSYQHVKAFGVHNHIYLDPWNQDTLFFVDDRWKIMKITVKQETDLGSPESTFQIPNEAAARLVDGRHNVTLSFPTADWLVLADGAGQLSLIFTDDRQEDKNWKVCHTMEALESKTPFIILHSLLHSDSGKQFMECLLLHVEEVDTEAEGNDLTSFQTVLEWLTFSSADEGSTWSQDRTRRLAGKSCPEYAVLSKSGNGILLASDKPFKFTYDSLNPVKEPEPKEEQNGEGDSADQSTTEYTWSQTSTDLCAQFPLLENTSKTDILYKVTSTHIELSVKNGKTLLEGKLFAGVDVDCGTWLLEKERLELHLEKTEEGHWSEIVQGDKRGELVTDPEEVARVHERLAHLTSESWNPDPQDNKPAYNAQQLEECDALPDECSTLSHLDGESHEETYRVNLGSNQWLFNSRSTTDQPPGLCLRHDVDGVLWQPTNVTGWEESKTAPWEHVATFNAFGYVQASKQQKKYIVSAHNYSFVALCDCVRHVYIYRQPTAAMSLLRNRKTGRQVQNISKQQLVSLESVDSIMGAQATDSRLYLLAGKTLYVVRVAMETEQE